MKFSRRTSIKALLLVAVGIILSLSIFEWKRRYSKPDLSLLKKKKILISEIAEIIIPRTDTPGAKDARVEEFILNSIEFCSDTSTQNNFVSGLQSLEDYTLDNYDRDFLSCSEKEKTSVLTYLENRHNYRYPIVNKVLNKLLGKPFITKIKELTIEGYCTSEIGATQGLAYEYIPVTFKPCVTLQKDQKSWATK